MKDIFSDKFFYHIYPLGMAGCPKNNDFSCPAGTAFQTLTGELDRIKELGCNALYIGPVFESSNHGYDTVDYYYVDRRLGNNQSFKDFCDAAHQKGFAVVLDAVFNHTGRDFFAFKDIQKNGQDSAYKDWYLNLNFSQQSCLGDCFDYEGWAGCMDLVKLDVDNLDVQNHIFGAVKFWMEEFKIDGLRLDAADVLSKTFLEKLSAFCKGIKPDFWLMGEVVHGDYNEWACEGRIDSVTNYQIYKALWSSVNEANFYELSYNLNREFGREDGMYLYAPLYNFLDNHDVDRIGSVLKNPQKHLYLLYGLMFTIPGIPSVYYGSEWGIKGKRNDSGDYELRPALPPFSPMPDFAKPDFDADFLPAAIRRFSDIRFLSAAIQKGDYQQEYISNLQFAFSRNFFGERVLVICNSALEKKVVPLKDSVSKSERYRDMLSGQEFSYPELCDFEMNPCDIRILQRI